jgi:PiT family inorganic phosphate transporter
LHIFGQAVPLATALALLAALGLALSFEFVNGFHDTANAVATVIYTHTLKPVYAVVWSGLWNLIGVLSSQGLVAFSVVSMLPVELVLNVGSGAGFGLAGFELSYTHWLHHGSRIGKFAYRRARLRRGGELEQG